MPESSFEEIWKRIVANAGETFHTITGLPFTYKIKENTLHPSRTEYQIAKSDFKKAYGIVPIRGPGVINNIVRGPAYVWAILHDQRVSSDNW